MKKACYLTAFFILLVFTNPALLEWYAKKWQPVPFDPYALKTYSCGIVAGGFASPDVEGNGYFNATADRFIQAVKLYKLGKITHILVSGGNGKTDKKNFREAAWVKHELTVVDIPDSVILIEDRSNNTADNARYARQMLDSLRFAPPYILITSAIHMPRASLLFKKEGLNIVTFPCNYIAGRGSFNLSSLLPQPGVMASWEMYLKETAAFLWYRLGGNK